MSSSHNVRLKACLPTVAAASVMWLMATPAWADTPSVPATGSRVDLGPSSADGGVSYLQVAESPSPDRARGLLGKTREKLSDWEVFVGVGARYEPEYEGSDEFSLGAVPLISAQFGDRVRVNTKGVYVDAINTGPLKVGLHGGYESGREEDDSDDLRGLGDIDMGGVLGLYATYELGPIEFKANLDKTLGGSDGLVGEIGAEYAHRWNRFTFAFGGSATWADSEHMESYFGISSAQAVRSGYARYDAEAGIKRFDLDTSVSYLVGESWLVKGQVGVGFLTGDAGDSPIVTDEVQPSVMLSVGYKF